MELKEDIKDFINEQAVIAPRLKAMDKALEKLDKNIVCHITRAWEALKQKVVPCDVLVLSGGSHVANFKLEVLLNLLGYVLIGRKKWAKVSIEDGLNGFKEKLTPVDPPLGIEFLREFAGRMTEELGISVQESQQRAPTEKEKRKRIEQHGFKSFDDANLYFDNDLELIQEGSVWYKGWDIGDPFLACKRKSNGNLVIAYATNGHGLGMNVVLDNPSEVELSDFIDHVEQDSDHSEIREKLNNGD